MGKNANLAGRDEKMFVCAVRICSVLEESAICLVNGDLSFAYLRILFVFWPFCYKGLNMLSPIVLQFGSHVF